MGCPRHLKWFPVKGESVAPSPGWGLKGKRQRKGELSSFFFWRLLLPRALSLLGVGIFACSSFVGIVYSEVVS